MTADFHKEVFIAEICFMMDQSDVLWTLIQPLSDDVDDGCHTLLARGNVDGLRDAECGVHIRATQLLWPGM